MLAARGSVTAVAALQEPTVPRRGVITILLFTRLLLAPQAPCPASAQGLMGYSQVNFNHCLHLNPCLLLAFIIVGSVSAGLPRFHFFPLVMNFYTSFQKTKQIVCLTSLGISGPGVAWEGKHTSYSRGQSFLGISKDIPD